MIRIRPALLRGRRVDFWPAACWFRLSGKKPPSGGYWRNRSGNDFLAALDGSQSLCALRAARAEYQRCALGLADARAAEAGLPVGWTRQLVPVPPSTMTAAMENLYSGK